MNNLKHNKRLYIVVRADGDDTPLNFEDGSFVQDVYSKKHPLQVFTKKVARKLMQADRETAFNSGREHRPLMMIPLGIPSNYMMRSRTEYEKEHLKSGIEMIKDADPVLYDQLKARTASSLNWYRAPIREEEVKPTDKRYDLVGLAHMKQALEEREQREDAGADAGKAAPGSLPVMIFHESNGKVVPCKAATSDDEEGPLIHYFGFHHYHPDNADYNYTLALYPPEEAQSLVLKQVLKDRAAGRSDGRYFMVPVGQ